MLLLGTVMDIPFPHISLDSDSLPTTLSYTIFFDNGTTVSIPLQEKVSVIPSPPVDLLLGTSMSPESQDSLLPPFLCINLCITYEHEGAYHEGFLTKPDDTYCFSYKTHINKCKED